MSVIIAHNSDLTLRIHHVVVETSRENEMLHDDRASAYTNDDMAPSKADGAKKPMATSTLAARSFSLLSAKEPAPGDADLIARRRRRAEPGNSSETGRPPVFDLGSVLTLGVPTVRLKQIIADGREATSKFADCVNNLVDIPAKIVGLRRAACDLDSRVSGSHDAMLSAAHALAASSRPDSGLPSARDRGSTHSGATWTQTFSPSGSAHPSTTSLARLRWRSC
ncbi:hypothetical protein B0H11DRAFT_1915273 [Mycena galericulata]|nr:hypothetical protein B0H11DRAFT_1915273 [Mycena galericulata]